METDSLSNIKIPDILVVDDVPANLKILGLILENSGYKVRPVTTGQAALMVAEKVKPDLILLDIMMAGMDGFEVCRQLKENPNLRDVPVIFISALNETNDIVKALSAGGVDYITKPFQAEEVKARVATHLQLYRQKIELQEQSSKLQQLNAEKDKFFSIIAHDLRGPIGGLMSLSELMADETEEFTPSERKEMMLALNRSSVSVFSLLENLLEWARMQQGLISFNPVPVKLLPIIYESIIIVQELTKSKGIEIINESSATLEVYADKNMLQAILRNLVSNAIKFTPRGGKITVSAIVTGNDAVEISVKDSGIGMSPAIQDNLFRLDVETNRKGTEDEPSSGLGLILVKEFVEKHGGKIRIESGEGQGSNFKFTIPLPKE
ncbi:MAG: hybrid sensor histidine kinase/response regulator [Mariniphaga sp.]